MHALLISTYDLGHSPFGLASAAAWLRAEGVHVDAVDLALDPLDEAAARRAELIALHVPMHTATRLALDVLPRIRALAPEAHVCAFGLYAAHNRAALVEAGADSVVSGETEAELAGIARRIIAGAPPRSVAPNAEISHARLEFRVPDRSRLGAPERYAHVQLPDDSRRAAGYTEASRGCRHLCRHCPVVPVYNGRFRIVPAEIVLEDIRRQVSAGARHVTFGDPDFLNGPGHALPLVRRLHDEFPELSYDVTIKIEHLLRNPEHLRILADTGCLFVTSAVESFDDAILERLDKGHTRADIARAVRACREAGLFIQPTFVAFTPWTTRDVYRDLLDQIETFDLVDQVPTIQLALRLLIPAGSRLLDLDDVREMVGEYDARALVHPWVHDDPTMDALQRDVMAAAAKTPAGARREGFERVRRLADAAIGAAQEARIHDAASFRPTPVPYLTEPWYC